MLRFSHLRPLVYVLAAVLFLHPDSERRAICDNVRGNDYYRAGSHILYQVV